MGFKLSAKAGQKPRPRDIRVVFSVHDEAIDAPASDIEMYKATLDTVHLKQTGEPAHFHIRPLTRKERDRVASEGVASDGSGTLAFYMMSLAFDAGVLRISNVEVVDRKGVNSLSTLDPRLWDDLIPDSVRGEIGSYVWKLTEPDQEEHAPL